MMSNTARISNVFQAFDLMWHNAYLFRKHATNPDGRAYWHIVKEMLGGLLVV